MAETAITSFNRGQFASSIGNTAMSNQFYASVELPQALQSELPETERFRRKIGFAIQATSIPEMTVGVAEVPFRGGAKVKLPADRDYSSEWEVTLRMDVDHIARNVFEKWSDGLVGVNEQDVISDLDLDIMQLFGVGEVHQLSRNGKILKSYMFEGIWPRVVGAVSFDWSADNTFITFPVTFAIQNLETTSTRNNVISEKAQLSGSIVF